MTDFTCLPVWLRHRFVGESMRIEYPLHFRSICVECSFASHASKDVPHFPYGFYATRHEFNEMTLTSMRMRYGFDANAPGLEPRFHMDSMCIPVEGLGNMGSRIPLYSLGERFHACMCIYMYTLHSVMRALNLAVALANAGSVKLASEKDPRYPCVLQFRSLVRTEKRSSKTWRRGSQQLVIYLCTAARHFCPIFAIPFFKKPWGVM